MKRSSWHWDRWGVGTQSVERAGGLSHLSRTDKSTESPRSQGNSQVCQRIPPPLGCTSATGLGRGKPRFLLPTPLLTGSPGGHLASLVIKAPPIKQVTLCHQQNQVTRTKHKVKALWQKERRGELERIGGGAESAPPQPRGARQGCYGRPSTASLPHPSLADCEPRKPPPHLPKPPRPLPSSHRAPCPQDIPTIYPADGALSFHCLGHSGQ